MRYSYIASLLGLASTALASPASARRDVTYKPNLERANAVKQAFRISWDGYKKFAFPNDSLKPISNSFDNDRNAWGASAIDALSTGLLMAEDDIVQQILDFVPTINFNTTTTEVSLFETTIRYLGGLVSAYDILTDPSSKFKPANDSVAKAVLAQAERLATNLQFAFDTPSGVPDNVLFLNPPRRNNSDTNSVATIGTLVLEWTRLSDQTGNPVFGQLAQKAESYLLNPKPALGEPFPGMVGFNVNITSGLFVDSRGGWGGGTDSFYEYLIKMYLYDPERFANYKDRWILAADSSIQHLASHPTTRPDLTFLALYRNATTLRYISQHLACFAGGNFILGGLTLNQQKYVDFGIEITNGCHETYLQTATGIGPEIFRWQVAGETTANNPAPPANDSARVEFYKKAGFWIPADTDIDGSSSYQLRPEVIESYYYAYRATGDSKYQEWAWDAFLAINRTCAAGSGYTALGDVNAPGGGTKLDTQESFWFAETLKYAYLIQAEDADWQLKPDRTNGWVYNTEAHPVRVFGRKG